MPTKKPLRVPCPHCGLPIYPAVMLGKIRAKKMTKEEHSLIASKGGKASKKVMRAKRNAE